MTKPRTPMSIENTLRIVLGQIEIERAAEVTGRRCAYLSDCTDESKDQLLTVRDLELLDLEHHAQFGHGFPLFEALGRRLESAHAERFVDEAAIARVAVDFVLENGQAGAALFATTIPSNDRVATLTTALRELEEADGVTNNAITLVRQALSRSTGAATNDTS